MTFQYLTRHVIAYHRYSRTVCSLRCYDMISDAQVWMIRVAEGGGALLFSFSASPGLRNLSTS